MGIPVDVVSFASWAGANTIVAPNHVQMSSVDSGYQGLLALEMVFHETSHTTMGGVRERIAEASEALGVPVPNGLWHQVLFMTSGEVTRQVLAEANVSEFTAYMYENGLFRRAHERLEAHWLPHLHGERGVEEAMLGLVEAASR